MSLIDAPDIDPEKVELHTSDQALIWISELIQEMSTWRTRCDVGDKVQDRQRSLWVFLQKQGQVIGALKALRLCGLIGDRAYQEFTQRAINALIPTVTNL